MTEVWKLVLYFNIEDFKLINAHYGSATGDKLLQYIGKRITDRWGSKAVCGRIGGDIFGVLLTDTTLLTQEETIKVYTESMKESPVNRIAVKCGIYEITDKSIDIATMLDYAKIAENP